MDGLVYGRAQTDGPGSDHYIKLLWSKPPLISPPISLLILQLVRRRPTTAYPTEHAGGAQL